MAWTLPRTWVAGELVTAGMMNTYIRDDFLAVQPVYAYGGASSGVNQNSPSSWISLLPTSGSFTTVGVNIVTNGGVSTCAPQVPGVYVCFAGYDARGTTVVTGPLRLLKNAATQFGSGTYSAVQGMGMAVGTTVFNGTTDYFIGQFFQTQGTQVAADAQGVGCVRVSS